MKRLKYRIALLRLYVKNINIKGILDPLARAIVDAGIQIEEVGLLDDSPFSDGVVDDECDLIENLLGCAFVVCQTQIIAIKSTAWDAIQYARASLGLPMSSLPDKESGLLRFGEQIPAGQPYGRVEILNALANYFKHRSQWKYPDWTKLDRSQALSADVMMSVGAKPMSTGNLRTGARFLLRNGSLADLHAFEEIVRDWGEAVLAAISAESSVPSSLNQEEGRS